MAKSKDSKADWVCPECLGQLHKADKTGAGVKTCRECGSSWFILKLRDGKETVKKQD